MTLEQLKVDYEDFKNCSHYPAMERIMTAMPEVLEVLNAAVKWRDSGIAECEHPASRELSRALKGFTS